MTAPRSAMVLAAGLGKRMRPLTDTVPKPLVNVAGKALIDYTLDRLADAGVETVVVNVHYFADKIESHVKPPHAAEDRHLGRTCRAARHRRRGREGAARCSAPRRFSTSIPTRSGSRA